MKTGKKKVLVFIKGLGLGGAERILADSLPYLDKEGFEYEFAYLLPWKGFLRPVIEKEGFKVHCLGMNKAFQMPFAFIKLINLLKKGGFDLIHAHLPVAGFMARIAGKMTGVPVIYTEHNLQERYRFPTRTLNRLTYRWNSFVFAVSENTASSIKRMGAEGKTAVLNNGVPVEKIVEGLDGAEALKDEMGIPEGSAVVGTIAVFRRQKRLDDWLEVAKMVCSARKDVQFLLVGHGPEEERLRGKVLAMGLSGRVIMPGFRADGRRLLGIMDVYLMTSEYEGLPVALLEAMCAHLPVVSTRVGGVPEAITDSVEGFLSPFGDMDALAGNVMRLISDSGLRKKMGEKGFERVVSDFNLKDRVKKTEEVYAGTLRRRGNDG